MLTPIFSQIDGGLVGHLLGERLAIGVDLLDGQRAEDRAEVAFERLEDDALDLIGRHAEEPLGRAPQRHVVAGDLDVGDGLDRHRDALLGVRLLDAQRDRDDVQREVRDLLEDGQPQRGAAADDAEADDGFVALVVERACACGRRRWRPSTAAP